jgi:hypothetical protein
MHDLRKHLRLPYEVLHRDCMGLSRH